MSPLWVYVIVGLTSLLCVIWEKVLSWFFFFFFNWLSNCVRGSMLWQNVSLLVSGFLFWFTTVPSPIFLTQVTVAMLKYHQFYLHIHNCCPGISSALSIFITCSREIFLPGCVSVCRREPAWAFNSFPVPPQQSQTPPASSHSCSCCQIPQYIKHRSQSIICTPHISACKKTKCVLFKNVRFDN